MSNPGPNTQSTQNLVPINVALDSSGNPTSIFSANGQQMQLAQYSASASGALAIETPSGAKQSVGRIEMNSARPHYSIGNARLAETANIFGQANSGNGYNNYCVMPTVIKNYQGLPGTAGTGQVVEPSMLYFPQGWNGFEFWLAAMPYDGSNGQYENPSIFCSHDGKNWTTPAGVSNPLVLPPNATDHNYDNTLFMLEDGLTMGIAYGVTSGTSAYYAYITSTDGVNWTAPVTMSGTLFLQSSTYLNTPCPFYDEVAGQWTMYSVNAPSGTNGEICYQTATSLAGPWSAPATITSNYPAGITHVFHIDLKRLPSNELVGLAMTGAASGGSVYPIRIPSSGSGFGTSVVEYGSALRPSNFLPSANFMYRCTAVPVGDTWKALFGTVGVGPYSGMAFIPGTIEFDSSTYFDALYARNGALMPNAQFTGTLATMASYSGGLFWDSFNHATFGNCTASGNGSATAWTTAGTGTLAIVTNTLMQTVAGNSHAYVNTGSADVDMQISDSAMGGGYYATFRLSDTSNFWRITVTNGQLAIGSVAAGAETLLASCIVTTSEAGATLRVLAKGNSIKVFWQNLLIFDINSKYLNSATNHGIQIANSAVVALSNVLMALPR